MVDSFGGMTRRMAEDADVYAHARADARAANAALPAPVVVERRTDPEREVGATALRTRAWAPDAVGLFHRLTGNDEAAEAAYRRADEWERRADERDSDVNPNLLEARSLGEGLAGVRKLFIGSAPSLVAGMGGATAGAGLARRTAMNAERRAAVDRVTRDLSATGIQSPLARDAVRRAQRESTAAATPQVAQRQFGEALGATAAQAVARNPAARQRVARATQAGMVAGGTLGTLPTMVSGNREAYRDAEDRGDVLAVLGSDTLAAGISYAPLHRLLGRAGAPPAFRQKMEGTIRAQLARAARATAKETGKQAASEGLSEGAQAFIQRAGHRYVNENIELFSREAFSDYAANVVGGAVLGGAMGGSLEAGTQSAAVGAEAARRTGRWTRDQYDVAKTNIKDRLRKAADKVREREARAGRPMGEDPEDGAGGVSASSLYQRARDGLRDGVTGAKSAVDRYRQAWQARRAEADLDAEADEVIGLFDSMMDEDTADTGPMGPLFAQAKTMTERMMLSRLDPAFVEASRPEDVLRLGRIMEKYATGKELAPVEARTLDVVINNPRSGITQDTLNAFALAGEAGLLADVNQLSRRMSRDVRGEQYARQDLDPNEQARAVTDEGEAIDTLEGGEDVFAMPTTSAPGDALRPIDQINSIRTTLRSMRERGEIDEGDRELAKLPGAARDESLPENVRRYAQLLDEGQAVQTQVRRDLLGELSGKTEEVVERGKKRKKVVSAKNPAVFTEFVKSDGTVPDSSRRAFEENRASAGKVEIIGGVDYTLDGEVQRRRALYDLGTLIGRQMHAIRGEEPGLDHISPQRALLRGLSEMVQAGIQFDPKSITTGKIVDQDGNEILYVNKKLALRMQGLAKVGDDVLEIPRDRQLDPNWAPRTNRPFRSPSDPAKVEAAAIRHDPEVAAAARAELARLERLTRPTQEDAARIEALTAALEGVRAEETMSAIEDGQETANVNLIDHARPEGTEALIAREPPPGTRPHGTEMGRPKRSRWTRAVTDKQNEISRLRDEGQDTAKAEAELEELMAQRPSAGPAYRPRTRQQVFSDGANRYVPDTSPVADVTFNSRHEATLSRYRAARDAAKTPKAHAAAIQRFGEEVGMTELRHERELGTITDARFEATRKRLIDPKTGFARRQLQRALRGEIGGSSTVSVRHAADDKARPAKGRDRDRDLEAGEAQKVAERLGQPKPNEARERAMRKGAAAGRPKAKKAPAKNAPAKKATKKATKKVVKKVDADEGPAPKKRVVKKGDDKADAANRAEELKKAAAEAKAVEDKIRAEAQAAAAAIAAAPADKHNYQRESGLAMALLRALGYTADQVPLVQVRADTPGNTRAGAYSFQQGVVLLSDAVTGRERVEVLSHEVGHAVIAAEISKATGVPVKDLLAPDGSGLQGEKWMAALEKANPELYAALRADYEAFRLSHGMDTSLLAMRAARSQPARVASIRQRARGLGLADRPTSDFRGAAYQLSMNEWLADHIGRALLQHKTGQSLVDKFFGDIARQLRRVFNLLFKGKGADSWRPAPSVEAWVSGMFDAHAARMKEATGRSGSPEAAQAAVTAAVIDGAGGPPTPPPPTPPGGTPPPRHFGIPADSAVASTMRYIRAYLPPQEVKILGRALNTAAADKAIRAFFEGFPRELALLDSARSGAEARMAMGYIAWRNGALNLGPQGTGAFDSIKSDFQKALGQSGGSMRSVSDDVAKLFGLADSSDFVSRIFNDLASGRVKRRGASYDVRADEGRARGTRQQRWNEAVRFYERTNDFIGRYLDGKGARLLASGFPEMRRLHALLLKPQGTTSDDPGYLPAVRNTLSRQSARLRKIHAKLQPRESHRAMTLLQRGTTDFSKEKPAVREAVEATRKIMDEMYGYLKDAGVDIGSRENFFPVMMDVTRPQDQARLRELLSDPDYEKPIRELFKGFEAKRKREGKPPREPHVERPPLKPEHEEFFRRRRNSLLERLRRASGKDQKLLERLIEVNEKVMETFRTGSVATLEKHIAAAETRQARYAAGSSEASKVAAQHIEDEIKAARARIKQLNEAGAGAGAAEGSSGAGADAGGDITAMIDNLVQGAAPAAEVRASSSGPGFRGANHRSMQFIYDALAEARKSGDAKAIAKHEKNVRTFASLQTKDPVDLLVRYLEPAVKQAERVRRFGKDDARIETLLERAKAKGATDAQIAEARDVVAVAFGTYGADGSPTLRALSPRLAEKFSGPRTRAFIQNMQAYQNLRLLPLATLTSMVDPLGIAVRSGGEFKDTWTAYKSGLRTVYDKASREEQAGMLELLGAADDMFAEVAIAQMGDTSFANRLNSWTFKYNGLQAWTRATRFMAMEAGHKFILRHAFDPAEKSVLYMRELGLRPGDVQTDFTSGKTRVRLLDQAERSALQAAGTAEAKAELKRDDRVRNGIMQFIDEAILRPNPMQTPMWVSDPYMGLVAQYKAFAYALYEQIYKRWSIESDRGNGKVLGAMMMYIPVMLAAEVLRELVQNLGEDERRDDWGITEYLALAAERTGLYSPRFAAAKDTWEDIERKQLPGTSQAGPTAAQARDVYRAFTGRRDLGEEVQRAMPAAALHRRWDEAVGL